MSEFFNYVSADVVRGWLADRNEIAFLDVREAGEFGEGHPFFAIPTPYSSLELDVPRLVPRQATRTVLIDAGQHGIAARAAKRLFGLGYSNLYVVEGGTKAWASSGQTLFKGVNLPSKTFGELVEHALQTPHISAEKLSAWQRENKPLVLLDGRTFAEHGKMTIPHAHSLPNGELARHWRAQLPSADNGLTPIVVHCAGRTRSIIGAEILRSIGIPNPVFALENGTQGWALAGQSLEHGSTRKATSSTDTNAQDRAAAKRLLEQTGAKKLTAEQAQRWIDDSDHTTYVLDIRSAEEFARLTLTSATHAPGGQLLQATDQTIGVRNARILLLDDDEIRAPVIAAWLWRLGHNTAIVEGGIHAALKLPRPASASASSKDNQLARIAPEVLAGWTQSHSSRLLDVRSSIKFRARHAAGSEWIIRPLLHQLHQDEGKPIVLIADDARIAELAAIDLAEAGHSAFAWAHIDDWVNAGLPVESTPQNPSDAQAIDYLFFVHDRHDGNLDAARRYLEWETGLIAQCSSEELASFRLPQTETLATATESA